MQAEAALDVLGHPVGTDDEPVDEAREAHEHVVEERRRIGQRDPLDRRVADVALVPQRLVLEARQGVAAQQCARGR